MNSTDDAKLRALIRSKIVLDENGCWIWQGWRTNDGYGCVKHGQLAHRETYKLYKGPIPHKGQIDHLCRVKPCCNPAHLQLVTRSANRYRDDIFRRGQMSPRQLRVARHLHDLVGRSG